MTQQDWSRWNYEGYEPLPQLQHIFKKETFVQQMSEINGEISRVLRSREKLEAIRSDPKYRGEPQIIRMIFDVIKSILDENIDRDRLEEVERAEELTLKFLWGSPDAPSSEELAAFWEKYIEDLTTKEGRT